MDSDPSTITAESLEDYKTIARTATVDLEAILQSLDDKLTAAAGQTITETSSDIREERSSIQNCLDICAQFDNALERIQIRPSLDPNSGPFDANTNSIRNTNESPEAGTNFESEAEELAKLQENRTRAHQVKKNVSMIDNEADGDTIVQVLVSTTDKTIRGKNKSDSNNTRTVQIGGHMSEESVQQLFRDAMGISVTPAAAAKEIVSFNGRCGPGRVIGKVPGTNHQSNVGRE
ncbi:uncharacterized protein ColSpa_12797 [Colletotrichum spaethianum]|uniref:Azaphilone pigments biosynthesis cluster protein L N-terminal domain-containing protein n=1 Tax=Colletotrichum spaethianum TaxID=700344 RepID=A0AA37PHW7_9PEZI|nr:uncharacterized protein ColSpa_12797 [Colletotrichum spaethianum]GKT52616.1 hypothetical protein ColSpa_12797 [Colletotrichum spaethianum]